VRVKIPVSGRNVSRILIKSEAMKLEVIARESSIGGQHAPLLFVHGSCHGAWCWAENFLDYFAAHGYSSYALSLRGHGQSDGKDFVQWASVKDYVADVAEVANGLSQLPVLIGHSLGGLVVQKYLEKYNAPAGVLIASSPASGMFVRGLTLFRQRPLLFTRTFLKRDVKTVYGTPALIQEMLFSASFEREKVERYAERFGNESFRAFLEMMFYLPKPRKVKAPMLVLGAANDAIVPQRAVEKTGRAYGATVKIFPDMAHDMMLEDGWEDVSAYIRQWLQTKSL
jgi:pimeloyl-ACP methyl ester carboxylesterase